jgi:hypothetical protein
MRNPTFPLGYLFPKFALAIIAAIFATLRSVQLLMKFPNLKRPLLDPKPPLLHPKPPLLDRQTSLFELTTLLLESKTLMFELKCPMFGQLI